MVNLDCDYLVVGAGASSLAFIDTIITELPSVKIILVDKNPVPGGHWQHAYDFVHLHQPSVVYGLASKQLEGSWIKLLFRKLTLPWRHRASKQEILTYYDDFIQEKVAAGNLKYFPNCEYDFKKGHSFFSIDGSISYDVKVKEKLVNGVLGQCIIPSQNPVQFPVDEGVRVLTPNEVYQAYKVSKSVSKKKYVVLGAGKTGMDTIVYLLNIMKVKAENIHWVISNDVWMISREGGGTPWSKSEAMIEFNGDERKAMQALEERGVIVRLDPNITPTRFRFPVIGKKELGYMRKVKNVIRKGRVSAIHLSNSLGRSGPRQAIMHFDGLVDNPRETFFPAEDYVFVHCTSPGPFNDLEIKNFFASEYKLDLYLLFAPPVTISMSVLAYLEVARSKGKLDLNLGEKLMMAMKKLESSNNIEQEEKKEESFYPVAEPFSFSSIYEKVSENDILKAVILPLKEKGQDGDFSSLVNLAIFLAIADVDPRVPYSWMKSNRLSFRSIPFFKCKVYENLDAMVSKGSMNGFPAESSVLFRLLRDKLEPLRGK